MTKTVHLIKLSVGTESVDDLENWQKSRLDLTGGAPCHVTRMWPKRAKEVLNGGSIYWVIKGEVTARQRIVGFDEVIGADGIRRCGIRLDPALVRVVPSLRRPFQGWRYLAPDDAPQDMPRSRENEDVLPLGLNRALAEIGVL